ncbi:MAG TPA: NAD(P)H-hydrate dehydratase [Marmoricola sp.]|nr:NAD(P)H-hydrate dehydratase [Marmoricola sp.]
MRSAHTVEQVRAAEAELMARLPEGALMQRAAAGLAAAIADLLGQVYGARVLLLVGPGDNGGDALWAGAMLARRGAAVEAVLLGEKAHRAGLAALLERGGRVVGVAEAHAPDVVVDGIVGIGGRPGLRDAAADAVRQFADVPVVAVDVASGVDVDAGRVVGDHVAADVTVTFGTHKIAHLVDPAAAASGVVHLVDIGLDLPEAPVEALQASDAAALLHRPLGADHKYTRGVVGVRAGSGTFPGAGVLCTSGAASGLCGMVRYLGSAADEVLAAHPEVVTATGRVQAHVVGSGMDRDARGALAEALADGVPTVVDADALDHLDVAERPAGAPELVLTPHAGELAALLGTEREDVEADPLGHARRAAAGLQAVCLLKGRHTLVAHPSGRVRVNTTGTPWLAVAGAGDVLAGVVGALLATGLDPFDAASLGVWLHGAAATVASDGGPVDARRVAAAVPDVVRGLLG